MSHKWKWWIIWCFYQYRIKKLFHLSQNWERKPIFTSSNWKRHLRPPYSSQNLLNPSVTVFSIAISTFLISKTTPHPENSYTLSEDRSLQRCSRNSLTTSSSFEIQPLLLCKLAHRYSTKIIDIMKLQYTQFHLKISSKYIPVSNRSIIAHVMHATRYSVLRRAPSKTFRIWYFVDALLFHTKRSNFSLIANSEYIVPHFC